MIRSLCLRKELTFGSLSYSALEEVMVYVPDSLILVLRGKCVDIALSLLKINKNVSISYLGA